jgi:hypothetical protein
MRLEAETTLAWLLVAVNDPTRNFELIRSDALNRISVTISYTEKCGD